MKKILIFLIIFISVSSKLKAQNQYYQFGDSTETVNKFTDSINVMPAIRRSILKEINDVNSKIHSIFFVPTLNYTKLLEKDLSLTLLGFYQEINKDESNDIISSKYFCLISVPQAIHGYLLKEMNCSTFLLTIENQEMCKWKDLPGDIIDPFSVEKPWTKLKSFRRVIKILDFKPFPIINKELDKEIER